MASLRLQNMGDARQLRVLCYVMCVVLLGYTALSHWVLRRPPDPTILPPTTIVPPDHHPSGLSLMSSEEVGEQSENVLFFNRVPKTGSEMVVLLLQWLQGQNTFRHIRLKNTVRRHLNHTEQWDLASEVSQKVETAGVTHVSFDRHVYFTNFTALGLKMPLYLNFIRDPVEKMASRFYYARVTPHPGAVTPAGYHTPARPPYATLEECVENRGAQCTFITGQHYDLTIPYFCGHQEFCRELNNDAALQQALENVEAWYPVVGVLEAINTTLTVLHHTLPNFFYGVTDLYYNQLLAPHHNKNWHRPKTTPEVEAVLRKNLTHEYEFYNFVRQRLYQQYQQLPDT